MRTVFVWILVLFSLTGWAQELPPVLNFSPEVYGADNQNWMISQAEDGGIYVANNKGLIQFNGSGWSFYPTPNETVLRSVMVDSSRVYTGFYMGFGYWTNDEFGHLNYTPLSDNLGLEMIEDEQFWNIFKYDSYILFQSLDRIYIWDESDNSVAIIESEGTIVKLFELDQAFYFQIMGQGLFTIMNGQKQLVSDHPVLTGNRLVGAIRDQDNLIVLTEESGFYQLNKEGVSPWVTSFDEILKEVEVYSFLRRENGDIVLGTIANGIYHLDPSGNMRYHIDRSVGLMNNTALSLFEDLKGNIWVGLDNGLSCVNTNSPIRNFIDGKGSLGTTYETAVYESKLYLGTNQGLFYRPLDSSEPFQFVQGTSGQVWKLRVIGQELFCGHDSGTFLVQDGSATQIGTVAGTWDIKAVPGQPENILIQGNYSGLYVLEKRDGIWSIRNKLSGFDISSKDFEFSKENELLLSHEYKAVYRLEVDDDLQQVLNYSRLNSVEKGTHASLVRFKDRILYANRSGIYQYEMDKDDFVRDPQLSELIADESFVTGTLIPDPFDRLWLFSREFVYAVTENSLGEGYQVRSLSIPHALRNEMEGHENISSLSEAECIMGVSNGYMRIKLDEQSSDRPVVRLNEISVNSLEGQSVSVRIDTSGYFAPRQNSISFDYSVANYQKFIRTSFQYRLIGWQDDWSPWIQENVVSFDNLPPGEYRFELRAKVNEQLSENTIDYAFDIKYPWYRSDLARVLYVIITIIVLIGINLLYRQYYRRQRRRLLEEELKESKLRELADKQEIMKLRNDKLRNEIESRNRELAASTMSTINKNNTLSKIKNDLIKVKDLKGIQPVIQHIDNTLNATDDWQHFEEAFNYADTDFFKKLKQQHPELTPNDLRLCVYLRLNLSSKEIAPLLNISPRSVEIKRYRLRKKLGLDSSINLNEYFIGL